MTHHWEEGSTRRGNTKGYLVIHRHDGPVRVEHLREEQVLACLNGENPRWAGYTFLEKPPTDPMEFPSRSAVIFGGDRAGFVNPTPVHKRVEYTLE